MQELQRHEREHVGPKAGEDGQEPAIPAAPPTDTGLLFDLDEYERELAWGSDSDDDFYAAATAVGRASMPPLGSRTRDPTVAIPMLSHQGLMLGLANKYAGCAASCTPKQG